MDKNSLRNEIIKCGKDPCYFIRKYVRIQHPKRGLIPFSTYDYQNQLVKDYVEHRFNIILKARQLGISEVTAAFAVWLMLFHRDKNIVVMASKAETAKNIIRKVKTTIKHLPKWLMLCEINTDNAMSVEFSNGSRIKSIATSGDAGRSEAASLLIIDEAAFIDRFDELWTGLYPTVQVGGRAIVLSTPNGVGNKFHQLYVDAETGDNDFHTNKLMWWVHPDHIADLEDDSLRPGFKTSTWFRKEVKASNMGPREVAQELECNFNASGETVLSADMLELLNQGTLNPIERAGWDRNIFYWWKAQSGKRYFITADVARGDGKDYSAATVWDIDSMEESAEYYGKVPPDEYAKLLMDLGMEYNTAVLAVENNTVGMACLEHIKLGQYPSVYFSRKSDTRTGEVVNTSWMTHDADLVAGFTTSQRTRPLIIAKLEEAIRNRLITIRSARLMEELRTFIWKDGRPQAMRNYNDDLIMSTAIAAWLKDTFFTPMGSSLDVSKRMADAISYNTNLNTQIAGASKDPRFIRQSGLGAFVRHDQQPMSIRLPNGMIADFSWLISKG